MDATSQGHDEHQTLVTLQDSMHIKGMVKMCGHLFHLIVVMSLLVASFLHQLFQIKFIILFLNIAIIILPLAKMCKFLSSYRCIVLTSYQLLAGWT